MKQKITCENQNGKYSYKVEFETKSVFVKTDSAVDAIEYAQAFNANCEDLKGIFRVKDEQNI